MTADERQHRIEAYIQRMEFVGLEELARQVGVSISTVRRDLNALEEVGMIRRTRGGARLVNSKSEEFVFATRDAHQLDEKEWIGRATASLIKSGQTVIIDAGTTAYHVAKHLQDKSLQIVTNSLPVANLFLSVQQTEVVVTGGVIYPRLGVLVGPMSVKAFSEIHADVAIMGAGGITVDGLTNSHALLIDIQRAMMKSARRVIFVLDHTKFGRKSVSFLCDLESRHLVVTDAAAPQDLAAELNRRGIEIVLASQNGTAILSAPHALPGAPQDSAPTSGASLPAEPVPPDYAATGSTVSLVGLD